MKLFITHRTGCFGQFDTSVSLTNCLFFRGGVELSSSDSDITRLVMRNCTMIGGDVYLAREGGDCWPWSIRNSAFDGTAIYLCSLDVDVKGSGRKGVSPCY